MSLAVEAARLGPAAARALRHHGVAGRVAHAFPHAAYVATGDEWLHVAARGAPLGPLTVHLRRWKPLEPGERVRVHAAAARVWRWRAPPAAPPAAVAPAAQAAVAAAGATDGLPTAVPDLAAAARRVAGVGPGLTPAGDDFLAGALLAEVLAGDGTGAAVRVLAAAAPLSSPIGLAYMRAAARGECAESVARVLDAVLSGNADEAARRAPRAARWGTSSGAAMLAGFAARVSDRAAAASGARPRSGPAPSLSAT
jgi:hypothetical protein